MKVKMECPGNSISSDTVDDQTSPTRPRKFIKLSNPESDMFQTKTSSEDTCLKVDGKCLFVSSGILSLVSPNFMRKIEEKVSCSDPLEIELEGKKYDDVLEFLKCIHPSIMKRLSMENIPVVLPLAFEYGVKPLLSNCIAIVIEQFDKLDFDYDDDDPVHAENICLYLAKSFEYNLPDLKETCLQLATANYYLMPKEKVKSLPVEAKAELQGRVIEDMTKRNEAQAKFCELESVRGLQVLMAQFSSHKGESYMRNPRVGYLEYTFDARDNDVEDSTAITVHDINWCIDVRINETALGVFLNGEMSKECLCYEGWKCRVFATVRLHNFKYCHHSMNRTILDKSYQKSTNGWGFKEFAKMEEILDPAKSFTKDGMARLEVYMYAEEPTFE